MKEIISAVFAIVETFAATIAGIFAGPIAGTSAGTSLDRTLKPGRERTRGEALGALWALEADATIALLFIMVILWCVSNSFWWAIFL